MPRESLGLNVNMLSSLRKTYVLCVPPPVLVTLTLTSRNCGSPTWNLGGYWSTLHVHMEAEVLETAFGQHFDEELTACSSPLGSSEHVFLGTLLLLAFFLSLLCFPRSFIGFPLGAPPIYTMHMHMPVHMSLPPGFTSEKPSLAQTSKTDAVT